jgi:hypothetical protein
MSKPGEDDKRESAEQNEDIGEGNRQADRRYREKTEQFIAEGRVEPAAEEAVRALDNEAEREDLEQAEDEGRYPAADADQRSKP